MTTKQTWVSREEAAAVLGVSRRTVDRMRDTDELQWQRDERSGAVMISRQSLNAAKKKREARKGQTAT